jgi:hypothetical protein
METPSVPTSTIPQSSTSPQGADFNPAQVLEQILGSNKENLQALAVKAATPVAGGHMGQVPSSMLQPQQQLSPMHMDNREVVGAHNAKMQGIGNAVRGVTHMLATVETGRQNKQKVEVASATQQMLVAQAGLDQAQQVLKQDPNNADAKAAVERNKASMNGILSNDKLRKQIAKGFNIDFTDPSANKTLEHQGVAQGQQMAQQHLDYAEQFQQKTPTQMVPNVLAQQQLQTAMAQQKANLDATKAIVPLLSAQIRAEAAQSVEKGREAHADALEMMRSQSAWDRVQADITGRLDLAKTQFGYRLAEISAEGSKDLAVFKAKLSAKDADSLEQVKAYQEFQTKSATTQAAMAKHIGDLQVARQKEAEAAAKTAPDKGANSATVRTLDQQIEMAKQAQTAYKQSTDSIQKWYGKFSGAEKGTSSNAADSGPKLDSASPYLTDSAEDPDE